MDNTAQIAFMSSSWRNGLVTKAKMRSVRRMFCTRLADGVFASSSITS
ncbi:MAG: hypothetical protein V2A66_02935 [Pseudomonadota bacterium]